MDLSRFEDESFDITLVLGPMYHMYTKEDKQKVLEEAIRVTKKRGHIFIAYCMNEVTMLQFTFKAGEIWDCVNNHNQIDVRLITIGGDNEGIQVYYIKGRTNNKRLGGRMVS